VLQFIKSPSFRGPIKEYVDENCVFFDGKDENSFEHTKLHNKFKELIETTLEFMLIDLGASQEQFLLCAKKGLESDDKKYFEQMIACDNFLYFKNMMVKRNLQLEDQAYKLMYENQGLDPTVAATSGIYLS